MKKILLTSFAIIVLLTIIFFTSFNTDRSYTPIISSTATLNFPNSIAGAAADLTMTLTGAVSGDAVVIGVPSGSAVANGNFTGWVSASNTITIRFSNTDVLSDLDPPSGVFRATIIKQ